MKLGMIRQLNAESFDYLKSKGLEFMEVCCNFDPESHSFIDNVADIKANIARTGVPIGSVGRWNSVPNKGGKIDRDVMELNLALLHAAAEVGSPVFVCGCNYDDSVSLFRNYCAAVENFGEIVEEGKKLGVKVAVYNCDWTNCPPRRALESCTRGVAGADDQIRLLAFLRQRAGLSRRVERMDAACGTYAY